MHIPYLFKGVIIGFSIAAPVGAIGLLCIRRTLQYGRFSGFFSGLGAAVADTFYGCIAAFGLTLVSDILIKGHLWLRIIGGIFLIFLGIKTCLTKMVKRDDLVQRRHFFGDFISTLLLTLTNPITFLSYIAIFAAVGLPEAEYYYRDAFCLILGVFFGSVIWWLLLSEGVTLFRKQVTPRIMKLINQIAGCLIVLFGLAAWASIFVKI